MSPLINKQKRFWVFVFCDTKLIDSGGMHDFCNSFDTIDDAKSLLNERIQVWDSINDEIVYER